MFFFRLLYLHMLVLINSGKFKMNIVQNKILKPSAKSFAAGSWKERILDLSINHDLPKSVNEEQEWGSFC